MPPASAPDPERLGGLAWARRTQGKLTGAERRRLLTAIAKGQAEFIAGRVRLALGRVPSAARAIDARAFTPPDSKLAREAEEACADQPADLIGHSYRTWYFGLALAALDGNEPDRELFYCAALLHDFGIFEPVPGQDFTLRSADRVLACAEAAGAGRESGEAMADGICVHTTPGATVDRDGAIGCYIQAGAMVDTGLRKWDISQENVDAILRRHPREPDFKRRFANHQRAEASAVPGGRFSLLVRCGLPLVTRMAPFSDG